MIRHLFVIVLVGLGILVPLSGCGRHLPAVVPVQGTVLLNGKPLPKAAIQFLPRQDDLGSGFVSTATTDEKGRFTLTCGYKDQPGAVVGTHIVLVTDPPVPEELRNSRNTRDHAKYRAKLDNRPIPPRYSTVSQSPLRIEIKEGQGEVKLELTR